MLFFESYFGVFPLPVNSQKNTGRMNELPGKWQCTYVLLVSIWMQAMHVKASGHIICPGVLHSIAAHDSVEKSYKIGHHVLPPNNFYSLKR